MRRLDLARNDAFGHGAELERKRRSGFMLDTARNFYPVPALYKMLDTMSSVKMNVFHWHVVEAQSWALASSTFPDLARYGAYSNAETYSLHDVGQVVKYAGARGISVMLEVGFRGNTLSLRSPTLTRMLPPARHARTHGVNRARLPGVHCLSRRSALVCVRR